MKDDKTQNTLKGEEEIIQAILNGYGERYDDIVERYQTGLYRTAYYYTQNIEDARDLTQDIFIKAYNNLARFKQGSAFSTWLYRIAVNHCLDWCRKKKPQYVEAICLDNLHAKEDSPEDLFLQQEIASEVQATVGNLPTIYSTVLILYYFSYTPTSALPTSIPKKTLREKFLFLCYSLVPGAAHMHLGLFRRGLQLMIITFGGIALINFIGLDFLIPFIVIPTWFFSFFEGHHLRKQVEKGQAINDQDLFDRQLFDYTPLLKNRRIIGFSIVIVGLLSLMHELDQSKVLDRLFGGQFYLIRGSFIPLCLILGGIYLTVKATRPKPPTNL